MTTATEKPEMSDATTAPADQPITLPIGMLRDARLTPEAIGAIVVGLAYQDDPRPLPRLLQEVGRMREARAHKVTRQLLQLGYATREQARGPRGDTFAGMRYRFFTDPQVSR
jgi:hypothetical protein